jgi:multiple sugar transport system ATP-binding protein
MTMTQHLAVADVKKNYGANPVLKGVSFAAREGEFIALVGPSGCGKSTLLRIIAGLEAADAGELHIGGRDVTALRAADRDVAMVFQSYALYPHLTARQNMAVPLALRNLSTAQRLPFIGRFMPGRARVMAEIAAKIDAAAESLKITPLLDRKPGQMSGGQRQRVALGRAIVRSPKAFLMDEPLSNLDAALRVHTRGEIVDLHRRLGATTVYVTHDQEEALSMADKIAVMKDGHILQFASPRTIYADPDHLDVAEFIGTPKINIIAADVSQTGVVEISGEGVAEGFDPWRGQLVTVGVRPDQAELVPDEPHIEGQHRVPFQLDRLEFLGSEAIAHGTLTSGNTIRVRVEPDFGEKHGARALALVIPRESLLVFATDGTRLRPTVGTTGSLSRVESAHV